MITYRGYEIKMYKVPVNDYGYAIQGSFYNIDYWNDIVELAATKTKALAKVKKAIDMMIANEAEAKIACVNCDY